MIDLRIWHHNGAVKLSVGPNALSLAPQDVTSAIADLLDAKRAQQAYIAAHANNEPAPDTRREGSASTWPAPAAHAYDLCVLEHTCDTCKYDSVEPEPECCLGCTNNKCRWEPAPRIDEIRGAK